MNPIIQIISIKHKRAQHRRFRQGTQNATVCRQIGTIKHSARHNQTFSHRPAQANYNGSSQSNIQSQTSTGL